jgi:membrane protein YdbS with pleckstrin-like domain
MYEEIAGWAHLDPAVRKLWLIEAAIAGTVYMALFAGAGFIVQAAIETDLPFSPGILGSAIGVGLLALTLYVAGKKYEFWRYLVGEDDLAVAHGIWWRTRIYVPRARIQHVDVTAGPIARALGLAVVTVFVSGHAGAVATIPGLSNFEAEKLRTLLLKLSEQMPIAEPPPRAEGWGG